MLGHTLAMSGYAPVQIHVCWQSFSLPHPAVCLACSLLNLELLLKFGPDSWRMHNEALAAFVARLQAELAAVRRQVRKGSCCARVCGW